MLRFAVLHHTACEQGDHFDFLIEQTPGTGDLLTFRLPDWPVLGPTEVRRLRDHRRIYLTYEGEVSLNRGRVSRVGEGFASLHVTPQGITITLPGTRQLDFTPIADDLWQATPR
jgi:hypothetical protein